MNNLKADDVSGDRVISPRISLIITSTSTLGSRVAVSDETLKAWGLSSVFTEVSVSLTYVSVHFGSS